MIRHPRSVLHEIRDRVAYLREERRCLSVRLADLSTHRPTYVVQPLRALYERSVADLDRMIADGERTMSELTARGWDRLIEEVRDAA